MSQKQVCYEAASGSKKEMQCANCNISQTQLQQVHILTAITAL